MPRVIKYPRLRPTLDPRVFSSHLCKTYRINRFVYDAGAVQEILNSTAKTGATITTPSKSSNEITVEMPSLRFRRRSIDVEEMEYIQVYLFNDHNFEHQTVQMICGDVILLMARHRTNSSMAERIYNLVTPMR